MEGYTSLNSGPIGVDKSSAAERLLDPCQNIYGVGKYLPALG
jgi:hypothetical protein